MEPLGNVSGRGGRLLYNNTRSTLYLKRVEWSYLLLDLRSPPLSPSAALTSVPFHISPS